MDDLLFLAHRIPYPPNKGDKLRSYHVLKYLSEHYRVHLGCFIDDPDDQRHMDKVRALCHETCFVEQSPLAARLASLRGLLTGQALSLAYYRSAVLTSWVARIVQRHPIGTALVFSSPMAQYLMPGLGLRRVIDFVDVDSQKWREYASGRPWPMSQVYQREARTMLAYERDVAQQFERSTFVSGAEAALFQGLAPESKDKVGFFNNGVDSEYFSPHADYRNPFERDCPVIVFTGAMDYWPNIQAVQWFASEVFAPLHARYPSLRFYIVGARPARSVLTLGRRDAVFVTGTVPDVRPYLAHAALAVAPLQIARGIQNKVLEAMAMQQIVIASPQALEGISAVAGAEVLVARDAPDYIRQIERVLSTAACQRIARAARQRVTADYSWSKNLGRLGGMLEPVAERGLA